MARSLIQNVVAVIVLVSTVLSPWSTVDCTQKPLYTRPISREKPLEGPVGDLVRLGSVDEMPILDDKDTSKKLKVVVVTRHGMYFPVGPSTLEGDKQKDFKADPPHKITEKGKKLMELVGKSLMKRYEAHFHKMVGYPSYKSEDLVKVTATDTEIGRESAEKIIAGMKDQNPELAETLKLNLLPDNIEKNEYFDSVRLSKQDAKKCRKFSKMANKLTDPKKLMAFFPPFDKQSVEDVFKQFDRLQMERLEGLELPDWTKKDQGLETLTDMKRLAIIRMQNLIGDDIKYWQYFISTIFNNIFKSFVTSLVNYDEPHFHLHVVDDHLMTALIWWLRMDTIIPRAFGSPVYADHYPQAGDSLVIEINKTDLDGLDIFTVFYFRPVGESGSQVGFKQLDLQAKTFLDYSFRSEYKDKRTNQPIVVRNPVINPDPKTGAVPFHWFIENYFIKEANWNERCRA